MSVDSADQTFKLFASNLAIAIDQYEAMDGEDLLAQQERQFTTLVRLEGEFREALIRSRYGAFAYREFIKKICDKNGNVLTARPYFRERQGVCIGPISQALKKRHVQTLYQFNFNYNFVAFAMACRPWPKNGKLAKLARQIADLRNEIVQLNMPLAISQARIFWARAPMRTNDLRFSYMDFVQIACDGLMSAVDKFVLPFSRAWRAVAIGRMLGNFIETFSETMVHFYPGEKKKIYRANKLVHRFTEGTINFEKLAAAVNAEIGDEHQTNPVELANLMAASGSSWVAPDDNTSSRDDDSPDSYIDRQAAAAEWQPDVRFERAEMVHALHIAVAGLTMVEQKLLRLRGVDLNSI